MGIFDKFKKSNEAENHTSNVNADEISYIADFRHFEGAWHQYDFLLASRGYGWDYAIDSAEYITKADLRDIGTVCVTFNLGAEATELVDEYRSCGESLKNMHSLKEGADIGIGGVSQTIGAPVKIVWFNQTRILRIFSPVNDEVLFKKYFETLIRRTFGTADAMKLYQKVPE